MKINPRLALLVAGGFLCPFLAGAAPLPPPLSELAAESFKEREAAQSALLEWAKPRGEKGRDWLFTRANEEADPEVRRRCLVVLRELVLEDYLKQGKGYVGVLMQAVPVQVPGKPAAKFGIRITLVAPQSPAEKAGLQAGALIVGVNDQHWAEPAPEVAFSHWVQARRPGTKVTLKVLENGEVKDRQLVLARRPDDTDQPMLFGAPKDFERQERESRDRYFRQWLENRSARR